MKILQIILYIATNSGSYNWLSKRDPIVTSQWLISLFSQDPAMDDGLSYLPILEEDTRFISQTRGNIPKFEILVFKLQGIPTHLR